MLCIVCYFKMDSIILELLVFFFGIIGGDVEF